MVFSKSNKILEILIKDGDIIEDKEVRLKLNLFTNDSSKKRIMFYTKAGLSLELNKDDKGGFFVSCPENQKNMSRELVINSINEKIAEI